MYRGKGFIQMLEPSRLGDIGRRALFIGIVDVFLPVGGTDDNNRYVRQTLVGLNGPEHLLPVDPGDVQIKQYEMRAGTLVGIAEIVPLIQKVDCLLPVPDDIHISRNVVALKNIPGQTEVLEVVFNEENPDIVIHTGSRKFKKCLINVLQRTQLCKAAALARSAKANED
jgi:hypothetical protein